MREITNKIQKLQDSFNAHQKQSLIAAASQQVATTKEEQAEFEAVEDEHYYKCKAIAKELKSMKLSAYIIKMHGLQEILDF